MTVNPKVNPKKLRPYDEPPKRRRTLIPDAPDSAATAFFIAAALWLALASGLGVLAIGMRVVTFDFSFPLGIFDLSFQLDARRVDYAFVNATVYGWLSNAGFAAIAFMTPRLIGRRLAMERLLVLAAALWNLALLGGIGLLYILDLGPHSPLTAFPWFVDGGLATAALIVAGAFIVTAGSSVRTGYVSLWFAGVGILALLGLLSLNAGLGILEQFVGLDELPTALASAFMERAVPVLWLLGVTFASLYYVVPRTAGQPLASGGAALLAWVTWLVFASGSALVALVDSSVPYIVTTLGGTATILLLIPVALTVGNLAATLRGRWSLLFGAGVAAFAAVSLAFLLGSSLLDAIAALRAVDARVSGTDWELGAFVWAQYGAFTMAALALAEHALPRVLRRAWGGGFLTGAELWGAFGGATIAGLALMGGGIAEGALLAQGATADALASELIVYRAVAFGGFGLVALAGIALLVNLFLMYTSAEPVEYVVPGAPAAAAAGH